jgi:hypothetical protein
MPEDITWGKSLSSALASAKAEGKLGLLYFARST